MQAAEPVSSLDGAQRRGRSRRLDARVGGQAHCPARHPHHPRRPLPAADGVYQSRLADGARRHGVASPDRSARPRQVRFLGVPPGHDGRVRFQPAAGGLSMPATWAFASHGAYTSAKSRDHFSFDANSSTTRASRLRPGRCAVTRPGPSASGRWPWRARGRRAAARAGPFSRREHFRNATGTRGHHRAPGRHRLEHRGAETLGDRAHDEDVERLQCSPSASARNPVRKTWRSNPELVICRSSDSRSSPSPTMRKRASGTSRTTRARGRRGAAGPCAPTSAATLPTTGRRSAARTRRARRWPAAGHDDSR